MDHVRGVSQDARKEEPMKKRLRSRIGELFPTGLLVLGAAAISWGIGRIYPPAGLIAAGALSVLGGLLLIRGGGEGE